MRIRVAAVGDMSFNDRADDHPSLDTFSDTIPILRGSDVAVANLESPLLRDGTSIPGKCTLQGAPEWAAVIKKAGIHIVSLANNHIMDFGESGLARTIQSLEAASVKYLGAGKNREDACAPLYLDSNGLTIAILARTQVPVSSPSYATDSRAGTAFLAVDETIGSIRRCKDRADIVILLIHWGLEEYSYPSAHQRFLARLFAEAGASVIIGHHPHVLQGTERIGTALVSYSLGNFVFEDVRWSFATNGGNLTSETFKLTDENRRGGILTALVSARGVESYEVLPTRIGTDGRVVMEDPSEREKQFVRLCTRLRTRGYPLFWRAYSLRQEWRLRARPLINGNLSVANLKKLRPHHFKVLFATLHRSARLTLEKTTNPYE